MCVGGREGEDARTARELITLNCPPSEPNNDSVLATRVILMLYSLWGAKPGHKIMPIDHTCLGKGKAGD